VHWFFVPTWLGAGTPAHRPVMVCLSFVGRLLGGLWLWRTQIEESLRVDHAGELGAVRIYDGQLAVLGRTAAGPVLEVGACVS
jgi:hypothetical protein